MEDKKHSNNETDGPSQVKKPTSTIPGLFYIYVCFLCKWVYLCVGVCVCTASVCLLYIHMFEYDII